MLLKVTSKCRMVCSHCMDSCVPEGEDMSIDIFEDTIKAIEVLDPKAILISGGEPTEHPNILEIISRVKSKAMFSTLVSNGMFLENRELTTGIIRTNVDVQITNDKRFYPIAIKKPDFGKFCFEDKIRTCDKVGRAKENWDTIDRKDCVVRFAPPCFNLRSLVRGGYSFKEAINTLTMRRKVCTPAILWDGSIVLGEYKFCSKVGNVSNMNLRDIEANIRDLKCNRCGYVSSLEYKFKKAIGEI
jgi:hypothetical protein